MNANVTTHSAETNRTPLSLLKLAQLSNKTQLPKSTVYSEIAKGKFPPPIKIGKSSRWIDSEIDAWIAEQAAARQTEQAGA